MGEVPLHVTEEMLPLMSEVASMWQRTRYQSSVGVFPWNAKPLGCTGGLDVIRNEAWPFYRTSSGVRLCWVSKNLKDLKNALREITVMCDHIGDTFEKAETEYVESGGTGH